MEDGEEHLVDHFLIIPDDASQDHLSLLHTGRPMCSVEDFIGDSKGSRSADPDHGKGSLTSRCGLGCNGLLHD
jgi:hypothetical protein